MKKLFSFFFSKVWPYIEPLFWLFVVFQFIRYVPGLFDACCLFNSGEGEAFVLLGGCFMLILFCIFWFVRKIFTSLFSLFCNFAKHPDRSSDPG